MSILHIDSSARLIGSNTRIIGQYLVNTLNTLNTKVVHRDLAAHPLPRLAHKISWVYMVHQMINGTVCTRIWRCPINWFRN